MPKALRMWEAGPLVVRYSSALETNFRHHTLVVQWRGFGHIQWTVYR